MNPMSPLAGTGQSASVEERPEDILEGASVSEGESEGGDAAEDANFGFTPRHGCTLLPGLPAQRSRSAQSDARHRCEVLFLPA